MLYNMFYKILYSLRGFRFVLYSILFLSAFSFNLCSVEIVQRLKIKTNSMIKEKKVYSEKDLYRFVEVAGIKYYTFRVKCPNCRAENNSIKTNLYEMAELHLNFTGNNNLFPVVQSFHVVRCEYNALNNFYRVSGYVDTLKGRKSYVFTFQYEKI